MGESARFGRGLQVINMLYGAQLTLVVQLKVMPSLTFPGLNSTPYDVRGWCFFEESASSIIKNSDNMLDLSQTGADDALQGTFADLSSVAVAGRQPPLPPDDLAKRLETKKFTSGSDAEVVVRIYTDFFAQICSSTTKLFFSLPSERCTSSWGPAEGAQLTRSLPMFAACESLELNGHPLLGSGGDAVELAEALLQMSRLQRLTLEQGGFDDNFVVCLVKGFERLPRLEYLWLAGNPLTDIGFLAFEQGLSKALGLMHLRLPDSEALGRERKKAVNLSWKVERPGDAELEWVPKHLC